MLIYFSRMSRPVEYYVAFDLSREGEYLISFSESSFEAPDGAFKDFQSISRENFEKYYDNCRGYLTPVGYANVHPTLGIQSIRFECTTVTYEEIVRLKRGELPREIPVRLPLCEFLLVKSGYSIFYSRSLTVSYKTIAVRLVGEKKSFPKNVVEFFELVKCMLPGSHENRYEDESDEAKKAFEEFFQESEGYFLREGENILKNPQDYFN
jgi:hypothetical protein